MDWDDIERRLHPAFEAVAATVHSRLPGIQGGTVVRGTSQHHSFHLYMSFVWDPVRSFEDLIVSFNCLSMQHASSHALAAPSGTHEFMYLEIERGNGHRLHLLGPEWLIATPDNPTYWPSVNEFVDRAAAELRSATPLIIDALREARLEPA